MSRHQVENALRRVHSDALHNSTVEVFEPAVTYTAGEGFSVTYPGYPDAPDARLAARIDTPTADSERDRSGTSAEIDAVVRVRDDAGQQWTGWGDDGEAAVHIRDVGESQSYGSIYGGTTFGATLYGGSITSNDRRYEVQSTIDENDGLHTLEVAEV